MTLINTTN